MELKKEIFREYDIRGIYNEELDESTAYLIGKAFASKVNKLKRDTIVVGYDNRSSSVSLEKELIRGITESGINVIRLGLVTTPMYFFSLNKLNLDTGCMITASHNPKEYNGFKMTLNGINNTYGQDVINIYNIIKNKDYIESKNIGKIKKVNIYKKYVNFIVDNIHLGKRKLKVVYDCGNGTTSIIADQIFSKLNIEAIPLFNNSDPTFPNHHPDPCEEENNRFLKAKVLEVGADIGLGFDGDGDRIGVVNELGEMIETDKLMIIIWRAIYNKVKNKKALFDVKCSKALEDELVKLGIEPICSRTGASYTKEATYKNDIPFGGEYSGHIYFRDRFNGHDDGIYNGLRVVEILSNTDKNISELLDNINKYYSDKTLNFDVKEEYKFKIIEDIKEYCQSRGYKYNLIDGVKVLYDDGFALIRASNTSPKLTYRYESSSKEKLNNISNEFNELLILLRNKYEKNMYK